MIGSLNFVKSLYELKKSKGACSSNDVNEALAQLEDVEFVDSNLEEVKNLISGIRLEQIHDVRIQLIFKKCFKKVWKDQVQDCFKDDCQFNTIEQLCNQAKHN